MNQRRVNLGLIYLGIAVASLVAAGLATRSDAAWARPVMTAALIGFIAAVVTAPIPYILDLNAVRARREAVERESRLLELLNRIHEHTLVSDSAKHVLYREREWELLREVIESRIAGGKFDAAQLLCQELVRLGWPGEVEELRARIVHGQQTQAQDQVHGSLERLEEMLAKRDWAKAYEQADRIRRLFPDSAVALDAERRIQAARQATKDDLESRLLDAAGREDVEGAMALLRELDRYLTGEEAERLREVAEGVVVKHRDNLGVQFRMAVNDHRWAEAARIGETIMAEFPNAKMADEVRGMIDVLRIRATQAAVAAG